MPSRPRPPQRRQAQKGPPSLASFDPFFTFFLGGVAAFEGARRVGAVGVSGLPGADDDALARKRSPTQGWRRDEARPDVNREHQPRVAGGRPDGVEIAAVASRDGAKAQAYAAEHGIARAHGSYEDLLADDSSMPSTSHSRTGCITSGR